MKVLRNWSYHSVIFTAAALQICTSSLQTSTGEEHHSLIILVIMQVCYEVTMKMHISWMQLKILKPPVISTGNSDFVGGAAYNPSGGYIPSFHKKEVGSAGQRIQLAPIAPSVSGKKNVYAVS